MEHVYDPITCLINISKNMKKGGIIYISVPCLNIPHSTPYHHYTGFTPVGLGAVLKSAGFEIKKIGFWGNKKYIKKLFVDKIIWPNYGEMHKEENFYVNEIIQL